MKKDSNILDEKESLRIISEMMETAKAEVRDNGFLYLLWGWLTFTASLAHYAMLFFYPEESYWPWLILMPSGGVITAVYLIQVSKRSRIKTKIGDFLGAVWTAFSVALLLLLLFMSELGYNNTYPIIIILYGIGTFLSGKLLSFKPLIIGGVFCWIIAGVSLYTEPSYRILLLALSLLISYIIPGHILKSARAK